MKNEQIIELVKELGLTDSEARVYFAALSLGPTTALKLSKTSDIKRATVYTVIDELVQKGYMRIEPRGFKRLFAAESPKTLERALEGRRERFREALPTLEALYSQKEGSSVIKYYEGLPAVRGVYESLLEILRPHDKYLVIADMEKWLAADPDFFTKWRARRGKTNVDSRMLFEDNAAGRRFLALAPNNHEQAKLLPLGRHIDTSLVITPHRAIIHQYTEPVSVLVNESTASIRLYTEMFDVMWESLVEVPD